LELPIGAGKPILRNAHGITKQIVGGWSLNGITLFQSGLPFSPGLNSNASLNSDASLRPDTIPGADPYAVAGGQNRDHWFNPAAYAVPGLYTFGNAGRDSLRGPGFASADWGLHKSFTLEGHGNLVFRWEVFNVFNSTRLANPNGAIDAGVNNTGRITSILAPMRQQQIAARWEF